MNNYHINRLVSEAKSLIFNIKVSCTPMDYGDIGRSLIIKIDVSLY